MVTEKNRRRKVPTLCLILSLLAANLVRSFAILDNINLFIGSTIYLDDTEVVFTDPDVNLSS
jgi:hypothetical protein